jgi:hypothetical protein
MLRKPTVFVLGAGASAPFGFPTGGQLYDAVVTELEDSRPLFAFLQTNMGIGPTQIRNFRQALYYSGKSSVDGFLEHRPEFVAIGKAAMAAILIGKEVEEALFKTNESWLRYMYDRLNASFEEFANNAISFITFNYDRSLEHFLFLSLKHSYGKSDEECAVQLAKLPIVYLHGRLGPLPWQQQATSRAYDNRLDPTSLRVAVQSIRIVHESDKPEELAKEFITAKGLIEKAEQLYFLGFGYNEINMRRLDLRNTINTTQALGTAKGIAGRERERIDQYTASKIQLQDLDCFSLVKSMVEWATLWDI